MDDIADRWVSHIELLESRLNNYWTIYSGFIVALIGWLISDDWAVLEKSKGIILVSICTFFLMNFAVIFHATKRLVSFERQLAVYIETHSLDDLKRAGLDKPSMPYRMVCTWALHVIIDLVVIWLILSQAQYFPVA